MDRGESGYIGIYVCFFFQNVVRIYVFKRKEWRGGNGIGIHSTCMYQKVFSSGILPTSSAGHVLGSAIKSGWDWQKVGLHAQKSIPAKPIASFHMPNP